jgi:[protein-PII] uridylyltransferase
VEAGLRLEIDKLVDERLRLIQSLNSLDQGLTWCELHTHVIEQAISLGFDIIFSEAETRSWVTVCSTGGFARREMAPYSDADITLIQHADAPASIEEPIRKFFRFLTDDLQRTLGVQFSYSLRFVSDCEGLDPVTRSSLLDIHFIAGSQRLCQDLRLELERTHSVGEFLVAKKRERFEQMARFNAVPLVSEPNLKEGAGGLRCFHTLNWMRIVLGEAPLRPNEDYQNLIAVRNLLHCMSGRKFDVLNRTRQAEIADRVGCSVEELMARVSQSSEALHQRFLAGCERIPESRFLIASGIHAAGGEVRVEPRTNAGTAAVGLALATELDIKIPRFDVGAQLPANGAAFLHAISMGLPTILNLDRAGILRLVLPTLESCRYIQSDDSIHSYTVYQHTLEVIRNLGSTTKPNWLHEVSDQIADDGVLYLAALLHDVGKADRSRPHSETGAEIAAETCREIGLDRESTALTVWLIQNHLAMTHTMRLRDLENPATITEFAELVESVDRLNHLTMLTYADVAAVGPDVWTASQETFLRTLYQRTLELLSSQELPTLDPSVSRRQVLRMMKEDDVDEAELQELINQLPAYYLASTPPDVVRIHTGYVRSARVGKTTIETFDRHEINGTEITVCAPDRRGLLSEVLGVLYAYDVSCSAIRACTTSGSSGVILDVITASYRSQSIPDGMKRSLATALRQVIENEAQVDDFLKQKGKDPERKASILSWSIHGENPTILEIRCPRGRGVPFRLSRWISQQDWNIQSARLGQWAGKAGATFYISKSNNLPVTKEEVAASVANLDA